MECIRENEKDALVLHVRGRLDAGSASLFEQECTGVIDAGEKQLVMDFSQLQYISSAGLRVILATVKRMKAKGGDVAICSLQPVVEDVFTVSGFATYLPIYTSLEQALDA